jgi:hypothetical protein
MSPYEDLVIALQTWRAKQGLPVAQLSGALTPPPAVTAPPVQQRPQAFAGSIATPPPPLAHDEHLDVDDAALIEEGHYENEGDDFAMPFNAGGAGNGDDSTAIGHAPPPLGRPSDSTLDDGPELGPPGAPPRGRGNNRDDW